MIGYCCNHLDGQLKCQASAHWLIGATTMYWLCYEWLGPNTVSSVPYQPSACGGSKGAEPRNWMLISSGWRTARGY